MNQMKANMGKIDRIVRATAAIVVALLFITKQIDGNVAIVLLMFAAAFILSSIAGVCPLYLLLKIATHKLFKK